MRPTDDLILPLVFAGAGLLLLWAGLWVGAPAI